MDKIIGIRKEDKNIWEKRTPLVPGDMKVLGWDLAIKFLVQPSEIRIFPDEEYRENKAEVSPDLAPADIILAIKEVPLEKILADKIYLFFSHTIKGQEQNMLMLKTLMAKGCTLIDYEKIVNEKNQRLIFFGRYAGIAGMIETFHALGQKLLLQGVSTPFAEVKQPYQYHSLDQARKEMKRISREISKKGTGLLDAPLVMGFAGYGNVSKGAQEIFDLFPFNEIAGHELIQWYPQLKRRNCLYKVVFQEQDMVERLDGIFDLSHYYANPRSYQSKFFQYFPYMQVMVNCIYWTPKYPQLVTKKTIKEAYLARKLCLEVIGDISCDVNGGVEINYKITKPDDPFYTYLPKDEQYQPGIVADGISVMAIDNLPCEFPRESSGEFSSVLKQFIPGLIKADFNQPFAQIELPAPIKKAVILYKGEFTPDYQFMKEFLK